MSTMGGDAGASETAARGHGRNHFADLRVLGDDDAGVGSADGAIVDGLLGLVDSHFSAGDL